MRLATRVVTVIAVLIFVSACRDKDVVTASYSTMAEARDGGASGDMPVGIPAGAHDIRVASDPDSIRRWGLFSFHPEDVDTLRGLLKSEEKSLAGVDCDIPYRIEWWPILLRGSINEEQTKAAGLQSYETKQGDFLVVVNWKQGRAYYWRLKV